MNLTERRINDFFSAVARLGATRDAAKARYQIETHYGGIDFQGKRVLDIGGGIGLLSFYAYCKGAKGVTCLEPEAAGSGIGANKKFNQLREMIEAREVTLECLPLQEYAVPDGTYDVIIMSDCINHLSEESCTNLTRNTSAYNSYLRICGRISDAAAPAAELVFSDCSSKNFFATIGLSNPFASTIEWHKHQPPEVWIQLMEKVGFREPQITWSSFSRFGRRGRRFLANRFASYFLASHFYVTMVKSG